MELSWSARLMGMQSARPLEQYIRSKLLLLVLLSECGLLGGLGSGSDGGTQCLVDEAAKGELLPELREVGDVPLHGAHVPGR